MHRLDAAKGTSHFRPLMWLKPVCEGSSFGVLIVREGAGASTAGALFGGMALWRYRYGSSDMFPVKSSPVPSWATGRSTLSTSFPTSPASTISMQNMRRGGSTHILPAALKPNVYEYIQSLTLTAHCALGCRGVSRVDFRYDETAGDDGDLICLEVNTQPGMTPTSLVPDMASHIGLSFEELVTWMVEDASCDR